MVVGVGVKEEEVEAAGDDGPALLLFFFNASIQHLEQQPPVASEPKNPQPLLHKTGVGFFCSLFALMVIMYWL